MARSLSFLRRPSAEKSGLWAAFVSFRWDRILAWFFIGFLLGRAPIFGEIWPFGLAYLAAWLALNRSKTVFFPFLGIAIGLASVIGLRLSVPYYAALGLLWLLRGRGNRQSETRWLYWLPACCLLVKMPLHYFLQPVPMVFVVGITECVLALVSFRLLYFALSCYSNQELAYEEILALLFLFSLIVSLNWQLGGFSLRLFLSFGLIVLGAKVGGLGVVCILGPALAFLASLLGENTQFALLIVIGSLLVGVLGRFRWGPPAGASLALIFSRNGSISPESIQAFLVISAAIWLVGKIPQSRLNRWGRIIPGTKQFYDRQKGYGQHLRQVLDQRIDQHLTVFQELESTLADLEDPLLWKQLEGLTELLQALKNSFSPDLQFTRNLEEELLNRFFKEDLAYVTVVQNWDGFEIFGALRHHCNHRRVCEQIADYCSGTIESQRYGVVSCNCRDQSQCGFKIAPCPRYKLEVGRAKIAQQEISGDSQVIFEITSSKVAILLSDGMGVGLRAHTESSIAVRLLERMIKAGYHLSTAVSLINNLLLLRNKDEMFVTIDLVVVDLFTGQLEFVKIGSAPSFIKRGGEIEIIYNHSLPVGVLSQVDVESEKRALQEGALLVMTTDGVLDAQRNIARKDEWMCWNLKRIKDTADMAGIAEKILAESLEIANGQVKDDMMVVVARLVRKDWKLNTYRRTQSVV
ncbi:MAG: SpoIIE family protein phosphatase [Firmicutes bacterium]|nr:SpoIIE family protein phosphatase [Bacillota bacterium]